METPREVTVNARKYDGSIRRSWQGTLLRHDDVLAVLVGRFTDEVVHKDLGRIEGGTVSFEHFWTDRWYNIFRFHRPDGLLHSYYCNIAMPAAVKGETLDFVDLDIDVVVWPDGRVDVLDRDDFEVNKIRYEYPDDVVAAAENALEELLAVIEAGKLP